MNFKHTPQKGKGNPTTSHQYLPNIKFISLSKIRKDFETNTESFDQSIQDLLTVIDASSVYFLPSSAETRNGFSLTSNATGYTLQDVHEMSDLTGFNEYYVQFHLEQVSILSPAKPKLPGQQSPPRLPSDQKLGILTSVYSDFLDFLYLVNSISVLFDEHIAKRSGIAKVTNSHDSSSKDDIPSKIFTMLTRPGQSSINANNMPYRSSDPAVVRMFLSLISLATTLSQSMQITTVMTDEDAACGWLAKLFGNRVIAQTLVLTAIAQIASSISTINDDTLIPGVFEIYSAIPQILSLATTSHFGVQQQALSYVSASISTLVQSHPNLFLSIIVSMLHLDLSSNIISKIQIHLSTSTLPGKADHEANTKEKDEIMHLLNYYSRLPSCSQPSQEALTAAMDELSVYTSHHPAFPVVSVLYLVVAIHLANHTTILDLSFGRSSGFRFSNDAMRSQFDNRMNQLMETTADHLSGAFDRQALTNLFQFTLQSQQHVSVFARISPLNGMLPLTGRVVNSNGGKHSGTESTPLAIPSLYQGFILNDAISITLALLQSTCYFAALKNNLFRVFPPLMSLMLTSSSGRGVRNTSKTQSLVSSTTITLASRSFGPAILRHPNTISASPTSDLSSNPPPQSLYDEINAFVSSPRSILSYLFANFPLFYVAETIAVLASLSGAYCDVVQNILENRTSLTTPVPLDFIKLKTSKRHQQNKTSGSPNRSHVVDELEIASGQQIVTTVDYCVDSVLLIPRGTVGVITSLDMAEFQHFRRSNLSQDALLYKRSRNRGGSTSSADHSAYRIEPGVVSSSSHLTQTDPTDSIDVVIWNMRWDALLYLLQKSCGSLVTVYNTPFTLTSDALALGNTSPRGRSSIVNSTSSLVGSFSNINSSDGNTGGSGGDDDDHDGDDDDYQPDQQFWDHLSFVSLLSAKSLLNHKFPPHRISVSSSSFDLIDKSTNTTNTTSASSHRVISGELLVLLFHIYSQQDVRPEWVNLTIQLCFESLLSYTATSSAHAGQHDTSTVDLLRSIQNGAPGVSSRASELMNLTTHASSSFAMTQTMMNGSLVVHPQQPSLLLMVLTAITMEKHDDSLLSAGNTLLGHPPIVDRFTTVHMHTTCITTCGGIDMDCTSHANRSLVSPNASMAMMGGSGAFSNNTTLINASSMASMHNTSLMGGTGEHTASYSLIRSFLRHQDRQYFIAMVSLLRLFCAMYPHATGDHLIAVHNAHYTHLPASGTVSSSSFPTDFFVILLALASRLGVVESPVFGRVHLPSIIIHSVGLILQFSSAFASIHTPLSPPSGAASQAIDMTKSTILPALTTTNANTTSGNLTATIANASALDSTLITKSLRALSEVPLLASEHTIHQLMSLLFSTHHYFTERASIFLSSLSLPSHSYLTPPQLLAAFTKGDHHLIRGFRERLAADGASSSPIALLSIIDMGYVASTLTTVQQLQSLIVLCPHILFQLDHHRGQGFRQVQSILALPMDTWSPEQHRTVLAFLKSSTGKFLNFVSLSSLLKDAQMNLYLFTIMLASMSGTKGTSKEPPEHFTIVLEAILASITFFSTLLTHAKSIITQCIPTTTVPPGDDTSAKKGATTVPQYLTFPMLLLRVLFEGQIVDTVLASMEVLSTPPSHHPVIIRLLQLVVDIAGLQHSISANEFYCKLMNVVPVAPFTEIVHYDHVVGMGSASAALHSQPQPSATGSSMGGILGGRSSSSASSSQGTSWSDPSFSGYLFPKGNDSSVSSSSTGSRAGGIPLDTGANASSPNTTQYQWLLSPAHSTQPLTSTLSIISIHQTVFLTLSSVAVHITDAITSAEVDDRYDAKVIDARPMEEAIHNAWSAIHMLLSLRETIPYSFWSRLIVGPVLQSSVEPRLQRCIEKWLKPDSKANTTFSLADISILLFAALYNLHKMTLPNFFPSSISRQTTPYPMALGFQIARTINTLGTLLAAQVCTGKCLVVAERVEHWEIVTDVLTNYPALYTQFYTEARHPDMATLSLLDDIDNLPRHTNTLHYYTSASMQCFILIECAMGLLHAVISCPPSPSPNAISKGNDSNKGDGAIMSMARTGVITQEHIIRALSAVSLSQLTHIASHVCALPSPPPAVHSLITQADSLLRFSLDGPSGRSGDTFGGAGNLRHHTTTTSSALFMNDVQTYLFVYHPDSYYSRFIVAYSQQFRLLTSQSWFADKHTSLSSSTLAPITQHTTLPSSPSLGLNTSTNASTTATDLHSLITDRFSWAEWHMCQSHASLIQLPHAVSMLQAYSSAIHHAGLLTTHIRAINSLPGAQQRLSVLPIAKAVLRHLWSDRLGDKYMDDDEVSLITSGALDELGDDIKFSPSYIPSIDYFIFDPRRGDDDNALSAITSDTYIRPGLLIPTMSKTTDAADGLLGDGEECDVEMTASDEQHVAHHQPQEDALVAVPSPLATFITSHLLSLLFSSVQSHFDLNQASSSLFSPKYNALVTCGMYDAVGDGADISYQESVNQTTHLLTSMMIAICASSGLSTTLPVSPSLFVDTSFLKKFHQATTGCGGGGRGANGLFAFNTEEHDLDGSMDASTFIPAKPGKDTLYNVPPVNELRRCINSALQDLQCSLEELALHALNNNDIDFSLANSFSQRRYNSVHNNNSGDDDEEEDLANRLWMAPTLPNVLLAMQLTVPDSIDTLSRLLRTVFDQYVQSNKKAYDADTVYNAVLSYTTGTFSSRPSDQRFDDSSRDARRGPSTTNQAAAILEEGPTSLFSYSLKQHMNFPPASFVGNPILSSSGDSLDVELDPSHAGVIHLPMTAGEITECGDEALSIDTSPVATLLMSMLMPLSLMVSQMVVLSDKQTQIQLSLSPESIDTQFKTDFFHMTRLSEKSQQPSTQTKCILASLATESSQFTVSASLIPALTQCLYIPSLLDTILPLLSMALRCLSSQLTFAQTVLAKQVEDFKRRVRRQNSWDLLDSMAQHTEDDVMRVLQQSGCSESLRTLEALKSDAFLEVTYQLPYLLALIRACPPDASHRLSTLLSIVNLLHTHNTVNPQPSVVFTTGEDLPLDNLSRTMIDAASANPNLTISALNPSHNPSVAKIFQKLHPILFTATSPLAAIQHILPHILDQPVLNDLNTIYSLFHHSRGSVLSADMKDVVCPLTYPLHTLIEFTFDLGDASGPSVYDWEASMTYTTSVSMKDRKAYKYSSTKSDSGEGDQVDGTNSAQTTPSPSPQADHDDDDGAGAGDHNYDDDDTAVDGDGEALLDQYRQRARSRWPTLFSVILRYTTSLVTSLVDAGNTGHNTTIGQTDPSTSLYHLSFHQDATQHSQIFNQSTVHSTSTPTSRNTTIAAALPYIFRLFDSYPSLLLHFLSFLHGSYGSNTANVILFLTKLDSAFPLWRAVFVSSHATRLAHSNHSSSLEWLLPVSLPGQEQPEHVNASHAFVSLLHRRCLNLIVHSHDHLKALQHRQRNRERKLQEHRFYGQGRRGSIAFDDDDEPNTITSPQISNTSPSFDNDSTPYYESLGIGSFGPTPTLQSVSSYHEPHPTLTGRGSASSSSSSQKSMRDSRTNDDAVTVVRTHNSLFKYKRTAQQQAVDSQAQSKHAAPVIQRPSSSLSSAQLGLTFTVIAPLLHYCSVYCANATMLHARLQEQSRQSASFIPRNCDYNGGPNLSSQQPTLPAVVRIDGMSIPLHIFYSLYYLPFSFSFDHVRVVIPKTFSGRPSDGSSFGYLPKTSGGDDLHPIVKALGRYLPATKLITKTASQETPLHPIDFYSYSILLRKLTPIEDGYDTSALFTLQSIIQQKMAPVYQVPLVYLLFLTGYTSSLLQLLTPSRTALEQIYGTGRSLFPSRCESSAYSQPSLASRGASKSSPYSGPSRSITRTPTSHKAGGSLAGGRISSPPQTTPLHTARSVDGGPGAMSTATLYMVRQLIRDISVDDCGVSEGSWHIPLDDTVVEHQLSSVNAVIHTPEDRDWNSAILRGTSCNGVSVYTTLQQSNEVMAATLFSSILEMSSWAGAGTTAAEQPSSRGGKPGFNPRNSKGVIFAALSQGKNLYEQAWTLLSIHISSLLSIDKGFSKLGLLSQVQLEKLSQLHTLPPNRLKFDQDMMESDVIGINMINQIHTLLGFAHIPYHRIMTSIPSVSRPINLLPVSQTGHGHGPHQQHQHQHFGVPVSLSGTHQQQHQQQASHMASGYRYFGNTQKTPSPPVFNTCPLLLPLSTKQQQMMNALEDIVVKVKHSSTVLTSQFYPTPAAIYENHLSIPVNIYFDAIKEAATIVSTRNNATSSNASNATGIRSRPKDGVHPSTPSPRHHSTSHGIDSSTVHNTSIGVMNQTTGSIPPYLARINSPHHSSSQASPDSPTPHSPVLISAFATRMDIGLDVLDRCLLYVDLKTKQYEHLVDQLTTVLRLHDECIAGNFNHNYFLMNQNTTLPNSQSSSASISSSPLIPSSSGDASAVLPSGAVTPAIPTTVLGVWLSPPPHQAALRVATCQGSGFINTMITNIRNHVYMVQSKIHTMAIIKQIILAMISEVLHIKKDNSENDIVISSPHPYPQQQQHQQQQQQSQYQYQHQHQHQHQQQQWQNQSNASHYAPRYA